jgi:hypothetical protein
VGHILGHHPNLYKSRARVTAFVAHCLPTLFFTITYFAKRETSLQIKQTRKMTERESWYKMN